MRSAKCCVSSLVSPRTPDQPVPGGVVIRRPIGRKRSRPDRQPRFDDEDDAVLAADQLLRALPSGVRSFSKASALATNSAAYSSNTFTASTSPSAPAISRSHFDASPVSSSRIRSSAAVACLQQNASTVREFRESRFATGPVRKRSGGEIWGPDEPCCSPHLPPHRISSTRVD